MQDDTGRKASTEAKPDPDEPLNLPEEDDDTTGEMDSAGQEIGLPADDAARDATSVEDSALEDEESDWIDHDDNTDKGRG